MSRIAEKRYTRRTSMKYSQMDRGNLSDSDYIRNNSDLLPSGL